MQVFDAVSGERRRRCGWMRCFGGDVGSVPLLLYLVLLLVPLPAPVQTGFLLLLQHCWQRPIVHRQAARRHATLFPAATWGRYRYPRAAKVAKGGPAGPGTRTWPVPVGSQKRCYPPATHANALREPEPSASDSGARRVGAPLQAPGLPPQRLRPHGRSPF